MPLDALAPWHQARPHLAINALAAANQAAPHLAALADFVLPRLPRRPLASPNIRSIGVRDRYSDALMLDDALTSPWMSVDSETARNAIPIDIDSADGAERVEQLANYGLPRPTLVLDPWTGRSHAITLLSSPVGMSDQSRESPRRLCDLAGSLLAAALGGTVLPHRALAKSPWGRLEHLQGAPMHRGVPRSNPRIF